MKTVLSVTAMSIELSRAYRAAAVGRISLSLKHPSEFVCTFPPLKNKIK